MSVTLTAGASAATLPVAPPASRTPAWWWAAALGGGPQQALWTLGGAPPEHHAESCGDGAVGGRDRRTAPACCCTMAGRVIIVAGPGSDLEMRTGTGHTQRDRRRGADADLFTPPPTDCRHSPAGWAARAVPDVE